LIDSADRSDTLRTNNENRQAGYRDYFDQGQLAQMEELLRTRLSPVFGYAMALRPVLEDDAPREQP
jgi:hypothetical protein